MDTGAVESRIQEIGRELFARVRKERPAVFNPRHITGRLMQWSMRNEAFKTQLFRLVDVLPVLKNSKEVAAHIREYLGDGLADIPWLFKAGVRISAGVPWLADFAARKGINQIAGQFILASSPEEAVPRLEKLRRRGLGFTADLLGETVVSEKEALLFQERYLDLIEKLSQAAKGWKTVSRIDESDRGAIPRVNISVKISSLYSQIQTSDPAGSLKILQERIRPLLAFAKRTGVFLNFDMESVALKGMTIELFKSLVSEREFKEYAHFGLALQAYLKSSEEDLRDLLEWGKSNQLRFGIRLIKGAYWDYEMALAAQRNWPEPVFTRKEETDAQYEKLAGLMLQNREVIECAFGTHNIRSIASCIAQAQTLGLPENACEFQMLYGMAEPIKSALLEMGFRVRDYCPIGEILPGMSYLVRRLLENSSNEGFLRASFAEAKSPEELLKNPALRDAETVEPSTGEKFRNEPHSDWTIQSNREQMTAAIRSCGARLGAVQEPFIGGRKIEGAGRRECFNPARPDELVGMVGEADESLAEEAVQTAVEAFRSFRFSPVEQRARLLERAAAILRARRFDLAAIEIFETGKTWSEADADVAEAIDFCVFYARQMGRIARLEVSLPGESNLHQHIPRGVGVIIAPWNFPLAILCGMTVAGLVTGNCVIMKPAEQSAIIAAEFARILHEAGFPPGSFAYLPGPGEKIGKYLVEHPLVNFVAFTGSKEVGLEIWKEAGITHPEQPHLKHVVCEMGGKNAMIIDSDADLDEAVPAIIQSAFGYQGQKCSALSRLIVLEANYKTAVRRLIEAASSMQVGYPDEPGTVLGPVISASAQRRILEYIEIGKSEATLLFQGEVAANLKGYFIPPTIFGDVPPDARMAQEEIFGPVLSILRARDFNEAIDLANDSEYALTAGVFSRSPANLERARSELNAGNIYLNRGITGALVGRQPFGGWNMSGGGTKAGGREYLFNFLHQKVVTENTMRRGFAPTEAQPAAGE